MPKSHKPTQTSQNWFNNCRKLRNMRIAQERTNSALAITAPIDKTRNSNWKKIDPDDLFDSPEDFSEAILEREMKKPWKRD